MEKFVLLFRGGLESDSPEVMQQHMQQWMDWVARLRQQGKYLGGEALTRGGKQLAGSGKTVTDGPFTEAKDVIGGFFLLGLQNYDEAVLIAKDCPSLEYGGTVEVRQVAEM